VDEHAGKMPVKAVRLGKKGIAKQIFLGVRQQDVATDYIASFKEMARDTQW
jgi:LysR family transcriptional regulator for metE and metH